MTVRSGSSYRARSGHALAVPSGDSPADHADGFTGGYCFVLSPIVTWADSGVLLASRGLILRMSHDPQDPAFLRVTARFTGLCWPLGHSASARGPVAARPHVRR